jgi:PKD repeat protein
MRLQDKLALLGLAGVLLLAASCGSRQAAPSPTASRPQPAPAGMPQLPSPAELLKTAATADNDRWYEGNGWDSNLPSSLVTDDGLGGAILSPNWNEEAPTSASNISYAIFSFTGYSDYTGQAMLFTNWQNANLGRVWIGLANFDKGHWDWYTSPSDPEIDLPAMAPYIAPDGRAFMAVLLLGSDPATLNWVLLGEPLTPEAYLDSDIPSDPLQCTAPLQVNFDASQSTTKGSAITQYEMDFDGDGTYDDGDPGPVFNHLYAQPGVFKPTVRVTDNFGHKATYSLDLHVINAANTAPTAAFTPASPSGTAPFQVNFDASTSSDPDGSIVQYEWDFDNDGTFDFTSTSPLASHTFSAFGMNTVRLRVTDNDLGINETTGTVNCTTGWRYTNIANFGGFINGQICRALEGSGAAARPCLAFSDNALKRLYFLRGTDNTGQNWGGATAIDTGDMSHQVASACSLIIESLTQTPAVVYQMIGTVGGEDQVRYSRAVTSAGDSWNAPVTVTSGPSSGNGLALAQSGGHLLVAERNGSSFGASSINIYTAWALAKQVQPPTSGLYMYPPALIAVPGLNPLLAWPQEVSGGDRTFVCSSATAADGADWNAPVTIPVGQITGENEVALAVSDGKPIFAAGGLYGASKLWFNRAGDAQGDTWPNPAGYLDENQCGGSVSFALIDGIPALAYRDIPNSAVKFIMAADADGNGWTLQQTVDSAGQVGNGCCLLELPGHIPMIAYQDQTNSKLKTAVFY